MKKNKNLIAAVIPNITMPQRNQSFYLPDCCLSPFHIIFLLAVSAFPLFRNHPTVSFFIVFKDSTKLEKVHFNTHILSQPVFLFIEKGAERFLLRKNILLPPERHIVWHLRETGHVDKLYMPKTKKAAERII